MLKSNFPIRIRKTARSAELKDAIIACFRVDACSAMTDFARFDAADWTSVMWWLDTSGMAIYFLHQARQTGMEASLPGAVREALEGRLRNNRLRTNLLFQETCAVAALFEAADIPYAILKGFTLVPESVPESALRSQADLDLLVSSKDAAVAAHCARAMGYRHSATFGNTMEFRAGTASRPDISDMYSIPAQRALDVHLFPEDEPESNVFTRRVSRSVHGVSICALSPADMMVQQALHLLKHLCGEHTRLSWVLEFWRHAAARGSDHRFWAEVEERAKETTNGNLALGISFRVAEEFFGETGASIPEAWKGDALPLRPRIWTDLYARQLITSDQIGNKLYALLRKEVACAPHEKKKTRDILLPRVLPNRILEPRPNERLVERLGRYTVELEFILRRLGFHSRESLRLILELARWRRATAKTQRMPSLSSNAAQERSPTRPGRLGDFKSTGGIVGGHGD